MNETLELTTTLTDIRAEITALKGMPGTIKSLQDQMTAINDHVTLLRRQALARCGTSPHRAPGTLSDECARQIGATFILHCYKSDKLEAVSSVSHHRDALLAAARAEFNLTTRAALT